LGIAVINPFWYTDLTENTEKERIFKGFSVSSVSSVYKNHGNSQRTDILGFSDSLLVPQQVKVVGQIGNLPGAI
jgi:hypothetical protein